MEQEEIGLPFEHEGNTVVRVRSKVILDCENCYFNKILCGDHPCLPTKEQDDSFISVYVKRGPN